MCAIKLWKCGHACSLRNENVMELFENNKRIIGNEADRKVSPAERLLKSKIGESRQKKAL